MPSQSRNGPSGPRVVRTRAFAGDVAVSIDQSSESTYSGPVAAIAFTLGAGPHLEQQVRSFLIPANTAASVSIAPDLNVNVLDVHDPAQDYLLTFTAFSGRVVGSARVVQ